jgi:hypothetical protein
LVCLCSSTSHSFILHELYVKFCRETALVVILDHHHRNDHTSEPDILDLAPEALGTLVPDLGLDPETETEGIIEDVHTRVPDHDHDLGPAAATTNAGIAPVLVPATDHVITAIDDPIPAHIPTLVHVHGLCLGLETAITVLVVNIRVVPAVRSTNPIPAPGPVRKWRRCEDGLPLNLRSERSWRLLPRE